VRDPKVSHLKKNFEKIYPKGTTIKFDRQTLVKNFSTTDLGTANLQEISNYIKITRGLKILKLLRLLRLGRFLRYLHMWEEVLSMDYGTGENIIKAFQWLIGMLFMCHWNACILYLVPTLDAADGKPPNGTAFGPKGRVVK